MWENGKERKANKKLSLLKFSRLCTQTLNPVQTFWYGKIFNLIANECLLESLGILFTPVPALFPVNPLNWFVSLPRKKLSKSFYCIMLNYFYETIKKEFWKVSLRKRNLRYFLEYFHSQSLTDTHLKWIFRGFMAAQEQLKLGQFFYPWKLRKALCAFFICHPRSLAFFWLSRKSQWT